MGTVYCVCIVRKLALNQIPDLNMRQAIVRWQTTVCSYCQQIRKREPLPWRLGGNGTKMRWNAAWLSKESRSKRCHKVSNKTLSQRTESCAYHKTDERYRWTSEQGIIRLVRKRIMMMAKSHWNLRINLQTWAQSFGRPYSVGRLQIAQAQANRTNGAETHKFHVSGFGDRKRITYRVI